MLQSIIILAIIFCCKINAKTYEIMPSSYIVGQHEAKVLGQKTLAQFCEQHGIGFDALAKVNPFIRHTPPKPSTVLIVPHQHLLPTKRYGIVINLAEKKLFLFQDKTHVSIYPIGIGRKDWPSPTGEFWLRHKRHQPTWYVPDSVRKEELAKGIILPKYIPPGEENPLGDYAMRLSYTSILIHGTNDPSGIGIESTSGCFSMFNKHIAELYNKANNGLIVNIIDEPVLHYHTDNKLVIASHHQSPAYQLVLSDGIGQVAQKRVKTILNNAQGIPFIIDLQEKL